MTRRRMSILSMAVLAPLVVDMPGADPDSSVTTFMVAAGAGSYADVSRGCEGQVLSADHRRFRDLGFGANHRVAGPLEVGVRGTVLQRMPGYEDGTVLWNPNASLEWRRFGFGFGYVSNANRPYAEDFDIWPVSGHLRGGSLAGTYFSMNVLEDAPMVSGGSPIRMGLGFSPSRSVGLWLGWSGFVPYDKPGFLAKTTIHVNSVLDLNATGRLGGSEGKSETAGSVGLTLRLTRDRKPGSAGAAAATPPPAEAVPDSS